MMSRVRPWLRALLRRDAMELEMRDELEAHLEQAAALLVRRGLDPETARQTARRDFGNVEAIKESGRDARGVRWLEELWADIRYGVRGLARTPGFTIVAVLSLTFGVGLNSAFFSVLRSAIRPPNIEDPATLVNFPSGWSMPAYQFVRERATAFSTIAARSTEWVLMAPSSPDADPRRVTAELVSENYFPVLGARMQLGRPFTAAEVNEAGGEPTAVLSYLFWRREFAADSGIIGRRLHLANGLSPVVVGVARKEFSGLGREAADLWLPLGTRAALPWQYQWNPRGLDWSSAHDLGWLQLQGRLAPGRSVQEGSAQVMDLLRQLARTDSAYAPHVRSERLIFAAASGAGLNKKGVRLAIGLVMLATLMVLLIACANVAGLLLARGVTRQREIGVRRCLGASSGRLVRQLLVESLLVAALGTVAAVVAQAWTLRTLALSGMLQPITGGDNELLAAALAPDRWVILYVCAIAAFSALAFGLVPALRATRDDLSRAVKDGGRMLGQRVSSSRLRAGLVVGQVAFSLVLLVSAGILVRSATRALGLDLGYERTTVLTIAQSLRLSGYDTTRAAEFTRTFEERLSSVPGVRRVAHGDLPLTQNTRTTFDAGAAGAAGAPSLDGFYSTVCNAYFETLGIPMLRGRGFTEAECRAKAPVVVVSEATARALWPNQDPIGRVVTLRAPPSTRPDGTPVAPNPPTGDGQRVVVGVARDAQTVDLGSIPAAYAYVAGQGGFLAARVSGDVRAASAAIRAASRAIDRNVPVTIISLDETMVNRTELGNVKLAAGFGAATGLLALALAVIGILGLVGYAVALRTREFGIRMALGARPGDVMRLVLRDGLRIVAIGGVIGLAGGAASARLLTGLLFGMSPFDPVAFGAVTSTLVAVTLAACYFPARRATRVDPVTALRAD